MLLKLDAIEEIGRFSSLRHRAPQFGQLVLLFARNGYGKSTICSVLRSAAEQDARMIAARRRLGASGDSKVQTSWRDDGSVTFATGRWNSCPGRVHIFDQEYVRRNLHVADSVTIENRRKLLPVVLGDQGVALARAISDLDNEQRTLAAAMTASERMITAACPIVTEVPAFVNASVGDNIDSLIEAAVRSLELAKQAVAVKLRRDPVSIAVTDLGELEALVATGIPSVTERAGALVKSHIEGLQPNGARWLEYGTKHMPGDACPFCTQDTNGIDLVAAFKGYFSDEYVSLAGRVDAALERL